MAVCLLRKRDAPDMTHPVLLAHCQTCLGTVVVHELKVLQPAPGQGTIRPGAICAGTASPSSMRAVARGSIIDQKQGIIARSSAGRAVTLGARVLWSRAPWISLNRGRLSDGSSQPGLHRHRVIAWALRPTSTTWWIRALDVVSGAVETCRALLITLEMVSQSRCVARVHPCQGMLGTLTFFLLHSPQPLRDLV
jgi:hypothetical protein